MGIYKRQNSQPDRSRISRHTNIMDIRSYRGAEGDTDHQLVITKVRDKLCIANRESKGSTEIRS